jgi:cytochrome P450
MVERIAATGHAIPDNVFDMIWFNSISLAFYPEKAFEAMAADQELRAAVVAELDLPSKDRLKSRALIMEMTRLHPRIASINYADEKGIQVAMIPTGNVDPERYSNPRAIDLERDHSDSLTFARPSHRACLAYDFAPDVMAAILAQMVRAENGN